MPKAREVMVWKYGRQAEWNTELLKGGREDGTMETGSSGKMYGLFWIGDPETMTGGRGRVVARSRHSMGGGVVGVRGGWLLAFFFLLRFPLLVGSNAALRKTNARAKRMEGRRRNEGSSQWVGRRRITKDGTRDKVGRIVGLGDESICPAWLPSLDRCLVVA